MEIQKTIRIRDKKLISRKRDQAAGFCEYCGVFRPPLHIHHIKSKGSGGDDTDDNLIALCFVCHTKAHDVKMSKDKLKKIVEERERWNT